MTEYTIPDQPYHLTFIKPTVHDLEAIKLSILWYRTRRIPLNHDELFQLAATSYFAEQARADALISVGLFLPSLIFMRP